MAGYDRTIDPVTGDYRDADGGEFEQTLTIAPAVYHQMKAERGRWWGDQDAGSDLYLAKHRGTGRAGQLFAEDAVRSALQVFVDQGVADDLEVLAEGRANGRIVMRTSITDVQHGPVDVTAPIGEG